MEIYKHISGQILRIRREKELTQTELATLINKSQAWVAKIERGETRLSIITLYEIADALNCSIFEILKNNIGSSKIEK